MGERERARGKLGRGEREAYIGAVIVCVLLHGDDLSQPGPLVPLDGILEPVLDHLHYLSWFHFVVYSRDIKVEFILLINNKKKERDEYIICWLVYCHTSRSSGISASMRAPAAAISEYF